MPGTPSAPAATASDETSSLRSELAQLRQQLAEAQNVQRRLERELAQTNRELTELLGHAACADAEHGDMVKLHVALSRLHEAEDRASALAGIHEVIVNIIGSEHFGLFELAEDASVLRPFGGMGLSPAENAAVPVPGSLLGTVATTGKPFLAPPEFDESGLPSTPDIVACVPLRLARTTVGVIAIYRLLSHKPSLEPLDRELLDLLSTHAASALAGAELRAATVRPAVAM